MSSVLSTLKSLLVKVKEIESTLKNTIEDLESVNVLTNQNSHIIEIADDEEIEETLPLTEITLEPHEVSVIAATIPDLEKVESSELFFSQNREKELSPMLLTDIDDDNSTEKMKITYYVAYSSKSKRGGPISRQEQFTTQFDHDATVEVIVSHWATLNPTIAHKFKKAVVSDPDVIGFIPYLPEIAQYEFIPKDKDVTLIIE